MQMSEFEFIRTSVCKILTTCPEDPMTANPYAAVIHIFTPGKDIQNKFSEFLNPPLPQMVLCFRVHCGFLIFASPSISSSRLCSGHLSRKDCFAEAELDTQHHAMMFGATC